MADVIGENSLRNKFRFPIATLVELMVVFALFAKWISFRGEVPEAGVEEWTQMGILRNSIALVDASYPGDRWELCAQSFGEGHYCHLSEGGHVLNGLGGWHYSLGIQLPSELTEGWTSELKTIAEQPDGKIRKLVPGEILAVQHNSSRTWTPVSGSNESLGTITIIGVDKKHATIKVVAKIPLREVVTTDDERVLEIDRIFDLDIVSSSDPLSSLPLKSKITKR
jgi:hypothetical protein